MSPYRFGRTRTSWSSGRCTSCAVRLSMIRSSNDDLRVLGRDGAGRLQEHPVGELHDVGLVPGGDLPPAVGPRVVEGEGHDPPARPDRIALIESPESSRIGLPVPRSMNPSSSAVSDAPLLELDPRVAVLGVLPDHHQIDALVAGSDPGERSARSDARVQIEGEAELHVGAPELPRERGQGPLESHAVGPDRREDAIGHRGPLARLDVRPRLLRVPLDPNAGGLDGPACRLHELRPDPVTRDQGDPVRTHERAPSAMMLPNPGRSRGYEPILVGSVPERPRRAEENA